MTEIPEHLLNRSKARRADASGDSTGDSTPAVATPAASTAPAKAKEAPAPKAVIPDPAYVVAAKTRKKIPFWAMTTLALLPAWAMLYLIALKPAEKVVAGPLSIRQQPSVRAQAVMVLPELAELVEFCIKVKS